MVPSGGNQGSSYSHVTKGSRCEEQLAEGVEPSRDLRRGNLTHNMPARLDAAILATPSIRERSGPRETRSNISSLDVFDFGSEG